MKQKWIIKIILILAIILIAGLLKTTSWAFDANAWERWTETERKNNKVSITRNDLWTSKYIFCRDKGHTLIDRNEYYLDLDNINVTPNPANYPIITYYKGEEYTGGATLDINEAESVKVEGADIAYIFSRFDDKKPTSGYSSTQWAYWAALGQVNTNQLDPEALKLYNEAKAYQEYIEKVEKFKLENKQQEYKPIIKPINETTEIKTEQISNNGEEYVRVGPFKIDYARHWDSTNYISFGTIVLTLQDQNGNRLNSDMLGNNYQNNSIYYSYKDREGNIYKQCARIADTNTGILNKGDIYIDTGFINVGYEVYLYIELNVVRNINKLNLCVDTSLNESSCKIYALKSDTKEYSLGYTYYCMDCLGRSSDGITHNGKQHYYDGSFNIWRAEEEEAPSKYYCNSSGCGYIGTEKAKQNGSTTYYCCTIHPSAIASDYHSLSYHFYYEHTASERSGFCKTVTMCSYNIIRVTESIKGCKKPENGFICGQKYTTPVTIDPQKLIILDAHTSNISTVTAIPFEISLIPSINIDLMKYNSIGIASLSGAEFKITAKQDGEELISGGETVTVGEDGLEYKITPDNTNSKVYVTIEETKAPRGYKKIQQPINIIYTFNTETEKWEANYNPIIEKTKAEYKKQAQPIYDEWIKDEEFMADYEILKNWDAEKSESFENWIKGYEQTLKYTTPDGYSRDWKTKSKECYSYDTWCSYQNSLESTNFAKCGTWNTSDNINYTSTSGDKFSVDEENMLIKICDEPVIEKIVLSKIDAIDSRALAGVEFKGTITNIKSIDGLSLTGNTATLKTNDDGKIVLTDLQLIDESKPVTIKIEEMSVPAPNTQDNYYYKALTHPIEITITHTPNSGLTISSKYKGTENVQVAIDEQNNYGINITVPNKRLINISGKVWLDGQTGLKPTRDFDGKMNKYKDENGEHDEPGVAGVIVELIDKNENIVKQFYYNDNNELLQPDAKYITEEDGTYNFRGIDWGKEYTVRFTYDGINYEDTLYNVNVKPNERNSDAQEDATTRSTFNDKFHTITNNLATSNSVKDENDENVTTDLTYSYDNGKSTLETLETNGTAKQKFRMSAQTISMTLTANTENIDLGLVKRGTDLALSTDIYDAEVSINGQTTKYTYKGNTIVINETGTNTVNTTYNLGLYSSDYNYRIRDYISDNKFKARDVLNSDTPKVDEETAKTGEELDVYVIYKVNLRNQSSSTAYVNEVKYSYDSKYTFDSSLTKEYNESHSGIIPEMNSDDNDSTNSVLTIDLDRLTLTGGETKTGYLVFRVTEDANQNVNLGEFSNTAEIMSYSTDYGLIDTDSQPGNFFKDGQSEDDNNTADTLVIDIKQNPDNPDNPGNPDNPDNPGNPDNSDNPGNPGNQGNTDNSDARKITGYVFDENNNKVDDVIVQLIELKNFSGTMYEYIWQETVSGSGEGNRINSTGTGLDKYTYSKTTGQYEFQGFIPGDYIVRFIYGDGTTYDMTGNVIKYNGQDYKSMADSNYNAEWYNTSSYTENASVARDNEARRLETMAYSVNVDAKKGLLLKLLDNVKAEDLNQTEKETLISTYNEFYDPDITEVTDEIIIKLLKEQVLPNTWMCAETSKIKVAVDTETATETSTTTSVNGINSSYEKEITNINFGLAKRPETKIELKKYITGFKLTASNGQVLVNAHVDVDKYLDPTKNISDEVQGIKNNVTILGTLWQYEVSPTELNTIVEGAKLEYEYTLVVRNTGENDNLSDTLINKYNSLSIGDYTTYLNTCSDEMKTDMRLATRTKPIGTYLGGAYYTTSNGYTSGNVQTEVTRIRDYINNDLTKTPSGDVTIDEEASGQEYRVLRDDYSTQKVKINTVLKTTRTTGKMQPGSNDVMYTVTLGRDPISSTGTISFENYIAEVMSYTNAAGRRATTSTPGNAEIIDAELREGRTHEIDEADTGRIQIGVKTGEDEETNYILITAIAAGILLIAVGAFVTKRYIIK